MEMDHGYGSLQFVLVMGVQVLISSLILILTPNGLVLGNMREDGSSWQWL